MHSLQKQILDLAKSNQLNGKNLREIANAVGEIHLQKIKHHLNALLNKNLLYLDKNNDYQVVNSSSGLGQNNQFVNLPIYGSANCGVASQYAQDRVEGYLKIDKDLLGGKNPRSLMVLRAVGDSMNKADVNGVSINHGDYLIIDTDSKRPKNGDYILSIIDTLANVKRYFFDNDQDQVRLVSESSRSIAPIVAKSTDNFLINGKIIKVIKTK